LNIAVVCSTKTGDEQEENHMVVLAKTFGARGKTECTALKP